MTIIDGDVVDPTNRNRQLPALSTNHGQSKAMIMAERLQAINPELQLNVVQEFVNPKMVERYLASKPDYIIDAIDSITPKITFIKMAYDSQIPLVSSMGAGAKVDPTLLRVVDISETYNCPFAQQVRKNLKKHNIYKGVKAVFSPEKIIKESLMIGRQSRQLPITIGWVNHISIYNCHSTNATAGYKLCCKRTHTTQSYHHDMFLC